VNDYRFHPKASRGNVLRDPDGSVACPKFASLRIETNPVTKPSRVVLVANYAEFLREVPNATAAAKQQVARAFSSVLNLRIECILGW
jgi:hypothetical protein